MAEPQQNNQPENSKTEQYSFTGIKVNPTYRTKLGSFLSKIKFDDTPCKFLVLKAEYNDADKKMHPCYLTCNFTTAAKTKGLCIHVFDTLNSQDWKIENWSSLVKTPLNINKTRKPTEDELDLIKKLKDNLKDVGLQIFFSNPQVVEASYSANNPKTGTNSANKQNQIDGKNAENQQQKQPNAAVQGAIEGMSEKNPALESDSTIIFDKIIRESKSLFEQILSH